MALTIERPLRTLYWLAVMAGAGLWIGWRGCAVVFLAGIDLEHP